MLQSSITACVWSVRATSPGLVGRVTWSTIVRLYVDELDARGPAHPAPPVRLRLDRGRRPAGRDVEVGEHRRGHVGEGHEVPLCRIPMAVQCWRPAPRRTTRSGLASTLPPRCRRAASPHAPSRSAPRPRGCSTSIADRRRRQRWSPSRRIVGAAAPAASTHGAPPSAAASSSRSGARRPRSRRMDAGPSGPPRARRAAPSARGGTRAAARGRGRRRGSRRGGGTVAERLAPLELTGEEPRDVVVDGVPQSVASGWKVWTRTRPGGRAARRRAA